MRYFILQKFKFSPRNIIIVLVLMCILPLTPAHAQCANPDGVRGEQVYNDDNCVMQFCDGTNWIAGPIPSTCAPSDACASVGPGDEGTICADGSVYAGQLTGVNLFVPPADNSVGIHWNNGNSSNYVVTGAASLTDGVSNTATIITFDSDSGVAGTQPHQAAQLCADLTAHGKSDWYLPAINELNVLDTNAAAIGGLVAVLYWSSSEFFSSLARPQIFGTGDSTLGKASLVAVRCVRR